MEPPVSIVFSTTAIVEFASPIAPAFEAFTGIVGAGAVTAAGGAEDTCSGVETGTFAGAVYTGAAFTGIGDGAVAAGVAAGVATGVAAGAAARVAVEENVTGDAPTDAPGAATVATAGAAFWFTTESADETTFVCKLG